MPVKPIAPEIRCYICGQKDLVVICYCCHRPVCAEHSSENLHKYLHWGLSRFDQVVSKYLCGEKRTYYCETCLREVCKNHLLQITGFASGIVAVILWALVVLTILADYLNNSV